MTASSPRCLMDPLPEMSRSFLAAALMCRNVVFTDSKNASMKGETNSDLTFVSIELIAVNV
jgi:hypothetical protein